LAKFKNKSSKSKVEIGSKEPVKISSVKPSGKYKKWLVPLILVLVGIWFAIAASKNFYTAAVVNNSPIYRHELIKDLEKQYGKQLLDQKIVESLILQRAESEGVDVSAEEVDEEVSKIEQNLTAQGQDIEALLAAQGMTRDVLRKQIRMQKLVEKLAPEPEEPSEDEIAAMLEQQADTFPEEMSEEERRQAVIDQMKQQQKNQSIQEWIQSLRESAEIQYLRNY